MIVDWTDEYQQWRERLDASVASGLVGAGIQDNLADLHLEALSQLEGEPLIETPEMMRVRQSAKYPLWRLSHPYVPGVAVRTIVWFPQVGEIVIVAIGAEKSGIGDLFYESISFRADAAIERYLYARRIGNA